MMPAFSAPFVVDVLDNPIYMGKIAYGRRRAEKKVGTRNEMHVVVQSNFPIYEGQHEAIVSEETWQLAHEKRQKSAFVREKIHDINHAHPARKSIQTNFAHVGGPDGLQFQADAVAYCG